MNVRSIDRSLGEGSWGFVVTTEDETVLVRCRTRAQAAVWSFAISNDPRLNAECSPIFPPQVVHYYEPQEA